MRTTFHTSDAPRSGGVHPRRRESRRGFTLVELLVVITLFLVLAGLVLIFLPNVYESQRTAFGATQVQGALQMAKTRATRDGFPRGIRLVVDANKFVQTIQFIEQPEDFVDSGSQTGSSLQGAASDNKVVVNDADLTANIAANDYLMLGSGERYFITAVSCDGTNTTLILASVLPGAIAATRDYRVIRRPRSTGEEPVLLPDSVAIDLNLHGKWPGVLANSTVDILFAPSGQVIMPPPGQPFLALWVRDIAYSNEFDGEPSIIGVFTNSGLIAAHDASQSGDPYAFLKDGRSSGK